MYNFYLTKIIPIFFILASLKVIAEEEKKENEIDLKKAFINGEGWKELNGKDFVNVNCNEETWRW